MILTGQIDNFLTETELDNLIQVMSKVQPVTSRNNLCHGIDHKHILHKWFVDNCFERVQKVFGSDCKLMFGMYMIENQPWQVHHDAYHCNPALGQQPFMSMIIPCSVDFKKELCHLSHTIVFEESRLDFDIFDADSVQQRIKDSRFIPDYYQQHLSHNDVKVIQSLSVKQIFPWQRGSLIYWHSDLYHDSDNFIKNGFASKQAIVIHTYKLAT